MSRLRLQGDEEEDDSIGQPYERNAYRRGGPGPSLGTSKKNPMLSLGDELDELTRSLDSKVSLQDLVRGKGQSHERTRSARDSYLEGGAPLQVPHQNSHSSDQNNVQRQPSFGSLQFSSVASVTTSDDGRDVVRREEHSRAQQNLNKYLQDEEAPSSSRGIDPPTTANYYTTKSSSKERKAGDPVYHEETSFTTPVETMNPRNRSYASAASRTRDTDTSQFEPPVNLQSPPFRLFSPPVPTPSSRDSRKKKPADARSRLFQTASSSTEKQASTTNNPSIDPPPSPIRPSSWQPILEDMRQTLEEKDERIRTLEEENEYLRSQLQGLKQVTETPRHQRQSEEANARTTNSGEGQQRRRRRRQEEQPRNNAGNDIFSPGTKFVAELAELVEIEVGHHAPLSYILDKYWDKLAPYYEEEYNEDES